MNERKPIFWEIFLLIVVIGVLHQIALTFYLYWTTEWFDIIMHFLGGFWVALVIIFFFFTSGYVRIPKDHKLFVFLFTLSGVLVVGLAWELWELFARLTDVLDDKVDTVVDIILDVIGGSVAYIYAKKHIWPRN